MERILIVKEIIFWVFLVGNTFLDIRFRHISGTAALLAVVFGMGIRIRSGELDALELFLALLPGIIAFFLAKLSNEEIGYGDAWGVAVAGIFLGAGEIYEVCMTSVGLAGLWALILLVFFHKNRSYEIPFFPFLLGGVLFVRCLG